MLDHVGLSVGDLDAQAAWYADALDLAVVDGFEVPALGLRGCFVVGDGWAIELLERQGSRPGPEGHDHAARLLTRGFGHLCLRVADVDAVHARLLAAGAAERMPPSPAPEAGVRMSFVADPEGNLIELIDRAGPRLR